MSVSTTKPFTDTLLIDTFCAEAGGIVNNKFSLEPKNAILLRTDKSNCEGAIDSVYFSEKEKKKRCPKALYIKSLNKKKTDFKEL